MHGSMNIKKNIRHYQNQTSFTPTYAQYYKFTLYTVRTLHSKSQTYMCPNHTACRYNNTVPFCSLEALPLFKQFQHIDLYVH